ncbi:hypothetical protein M501DRAFT_1004642 [Patellaria atrata CBS 101060]|uniref:Uncharacterized protein n=1 Tax=Patellaria atrata CBS 101060 TaxID=1346257 RepID=A0A9P4SBX6_9PEZI|nr:hypothetical protein M501DRAFT_1004642 [Patellaria atrata CBS 101060]
MESELVILPAIICQRARFATRMHLRACLRVRFDRDEVEHLQRCIEGIVALCGKDITGMLRVSDIPDEET